MKLFRTRRASVSKVETMERAKRRKRIAEKREELKQVERGIIGMIEKSGSLPLNEQAQYARNINDAVKKRDALILEIKKFVLLDKYQNRKKY